MTTDWHISGRNCFAALVSAFLVAVDQRGVDIVLTAIAPDGKPLTGSYKFEVRTWNKAIANGKYAIRIVELRTSVPEDRNRIAAQAETQHKYDLAEKPRLISMRDQYAKQFSQTIAGAMRKRGIISRVEAIGPDKNILKFTTNDKKATSSLLDV